jgi:hypothetical protein
MGEQLNLSKTFETRILEELTFLADHVLSMEKQLRDMNLRLEQQNAFKENLRSI